MSTIQFNRITIIGLGHIGSSIARAIKQLHLANELVVTDGAAAIRARAAEIGLGDRVAQSNVEAALAEVRRLPGAAHATSWIDAARRYVDAHRALDQLEAVAIVGPVPATTTPTAPVTAPAPAPSPAAPDNGTFF